jgi:hypothetical protein
MAGCDSIGSRPRRHWGDDFATIVEVSSLDVGVFAQIRSRRLPVGCLLVSDDRFDRDYPHGLTRGSVRGIFFFSLGLGEATRDWSGSASTTQSDLKCALSLSKHPGAVVPQADGMELTVAFTH